MFLWLDSVKAWAGERSALFFEFARVLRALRPRWCLIENVPGLLNSNQGRDMAAVVDTLGNIGYWWTYRVLDSQYFGVPQRRRRVYIVGHLGGPCPPEILFEPESGNRDSTPGREAGAEVTGTIGGGSGKRGWTNDLDRSGAFIPEVFSRAIAIRTAQTGSNGWGVGEDGQAYTMDGSARRQAIVANTLLGIGGYDGSPDPGRHSLVVRAAADADGVREAPGVPGRLDSDFDDAFAIETAEYWRNELAGPDGPRYAALGDAVTVPVAEWIGRRLLKEHQEGL